MDRSLLAYKRVSEVPSHVEAQGLADIVDDSVVEDEPDLSHVSEDGPSRWSRGTYIKSRMPHPHVTKHSTARLRRINTKVGTQWSIPSASGKHQFATPTSYMHTVIALSGKGTVLNAIGYALREKLLDEPEEFAGVSDYPRDDAHFDIVMVLLTRTTARNVRTLYALLGTIRAGGHRGDEEVDPSPLIVKPFVYMCDPWNRMLVPIHVHEHNKYPPFLKPSINVGVPHDDRNLYVLFPTREIRDTSVDHSFGSENAFIPICDNSLMYYVMGTRHEKWEKLPSSFQVHRSVICRLLKMYQCCTWATIVCLISPPPQAWVSEQILSAVQVAFKYQRSTKAK